MAATGFVYYSLTNQNPQKIVAFCGSAGKPALEAAAEKYEEKTGIKVELNFGGSGTMLSKMKMSKKGDLYIPGSPDYMVRAIEDNVVLLAWVKKIAYVVPAIITPKNNPKNVTSLEDLAKKDMKVGIGEPESVCVGEYAVEILKVNDLFDETEKNITVHAKSCSDTASLAVIGKVDAVIGWRVFHHWNPEKTEIVHIDPYKIPKIAFIPAAVSKYTESKKEAQKFIEYLVSPTGNQFFHRYGYIATENEARELAPNAKILKIAGG
ncbi:hypothetical protein AKJ62_02850 [candidate division MSBL1 archaeon SCGC-AAA259D14]|uniref:Molybdenum ABC transporter substrate-binding protein n=2 Tax=candidate division MSBL1 TaxID=215777 RepID=A0A133URW9_9EURY|nr:hypothetical protein AKJ62_02850 [candidate division MSBL1 archaeon SCGC-AAA259D14]KXA96975.1 hypothetical protein AKJ38_02230 [candidate division MSBL1 archaeon SCGC-AAA259I14]